MSFVQSSNFFFGISLEHWGLGPLQVGGPGSLYCLNPVQLRHVADAVTTKPNVHPSVFTEKFTAAANTECFTEGHSCLCRYTALHSCTCLECERSTGRERNI